MSDVVQLQSVEFYIQRSGVKALIYGKSGVGKTRLALSCPKPVIFSAENGLRSLDGSKIPVYPPIKTIGDLITAYNWAATSAQAKQFDTIFIDSISEIAEVLLNGCKARVKDPRQAYNEAFDMVFNGAIRRFRDLPNKNVIFTAKEDFEKDGDGALMYMPAMPSKAMRGELPYYFDEVFRIVQWTDTATNKSVTGLQCQSDAKTSAKDRSGKLDVYEYPDLSQVFAKMNSK